jgi:hypothetical protein
VRKIQTLFVRDWDGDRRYVLPAVSSGCKWVLEGRGTATRKLDGTCCMFDGERWWARREVKEGKTPPPGFAEIEHDDETGKTVGYEPVEQSAFAKWHAEVVDRNSGRQWPVGTYELIGPKVNGNPEDAMDHHLVSHETAQTLGDAPRDFDGLAAWLHAHPYEGIVWHHPDGRMAKIKKRDFRAP